MDNAPRLNQDANQENIANETENNLPHNRRRAHIRRNNVNVYSREGIFMHYFFLNIALRYSSYFKARSRRLIELFALLIALAMLAVLSYIHFTFVKTSNDCLSHVKEIWPRSGILRVQVTSNSSAPSYILYFAKKSDVDADSISLRSTPYDITMTYSYSVSNEDIVNFKLWKDMKDNIARDNNSEFTLNSKCPNTNGIQALTAFRLLEQSCPVISQHYIDQIEERFHRKIKSSIPKLTFQQRTAHDTDSIRLIKDELSFFETYENVHFPFEPSEIREYYVIEYSSEFGYLRLSTEARHKLAIPTLVVNLKPEHDLCFGSPLKKYMLETFLGYDDYLMSGIKKLAENEKTQGYLRNLVTGEYFRFVQMWVSHASIIIAFSAMVVFTLVVTMLLRYSYHQIFMFMVEVLRLLDTETRLIFPAAPMLTIVLALVGMEEIMTEFFHDSTVAFYVILMIWAADQFDVICLHTMVSRRHWVRFFFLYHFIFYAYHYKVNGQHSKLALFSSWLFIQHSMLYFFHHYELPAIQRQMNAISNRNHNRRQQNNEPTDHDQQPPSSQPDNSQPESTEVPSTSQDSINLNEDVNLPTQTLANNEGEENMPTSNDTKGALVLNHAFLFIEPTSFTEHRLLHTKSFSQMFSKVFIFSLLGVALIILSLTLGTNNLMPSYQSLDIIKIREMP